jgi:hypothetical protein
MDTQAFKALAESLTISEDIALEVSMADDPKLKLMAAMSFASILEGPEELNPAIGALVALAVEAAERRITRGG